MVATCLHQTLAETKQRWSDPRTIALTVDELTVCPCCTGPARVGDPIEVDEQGDFTIDGTTYRAYPGFEARYIGPCSRCK